jgi:UPF0755 protein
VTETDPNDPSEQPSDPSPPKKRRGKILRGALIAATLMVVAMGAGVTMLWHWAQGVHTGPGPLTAETTVLIEPGSGLQAIARVLEDAEVIAHREVFIAMLRQDGRHTRLKAGEYAFAPGVSQDEVARKLIDNDVVDRFITVPEGLTVVEVLALIAEAEGLEGEVGPPPPQGSLMPETYHYSRGDSRADLVARMRAEMDETLAELWESRPDGLPYATPEEALTMASIIEKETGVGGERAKVAGVFVNRLRVPMRLQSDPTVIYALTEGEAPLGRALTRKDWEIDHPYNTYRIDGLPPGPIANPGRAALEAALNPAETDALYFVADGTGGHAFARTLAEHNRNVAKWRKIRDGGGD